MHVLYFGEWRDGSLHDGMINLKKTSKSIYNWFFGINQNYLNKSIILDNAENLGAQIEPAKM